MLGHYDAFTDWPLLLSAGAPEWVLPMVEAFFGSSREIVRFSYQQRFTTRVGRLCVPWILRQPAFHPNVGRVFEHIAAGATEDRDGRPGRRICVVREQQGTKRRLTNAEAVTALIESHGFERVHADQMAFIDQVTLFAETDVAVGEAGSGLHGTIFSPPGMTTLEMRPETYGGLAQPAIAVLRGHSFTSVTGSSPGTGAMSHAPWTLDLQTLEQRLDELAL